MRRLLVVPAALAAALALLALLPSCPPAPLQARVARVESRAELIGGPRALGEVGDWLLENDKIRVIIQDEGFSRGFGVFGGALLDADLVRPEAGRGDSSGGHGRDNFGEMFPAFFLEALNPTPVPNPANPAELLPAIEIERSGADGGDAVLLVRALGDDFLAITQGVNETALQDPRFNPVFVFETRYILKPGAQHIEIETTIRNQHPLNAQRFPKELFGAQVPTPFGDVVLFGAGNKVFVPHEAGFDPRFRLEELYAEGSIGLPALPGLVGEFIASASDDVSYGVMSFPPEAPAKNFAFANKDAFPEAREHSLHVPFIASAFTGVFQVLAPDVLAPDDGAPGGPDEFKVRRAFIVGDGDIASISDVVYRLLGDETGTLQGRVMERQLPRFAERASVVVLDGAGTKVTQARADANGRFDAELRPGRYQLVVVVAGQDPAPPVPVEIIKDQLTFQELVVDSPAEVIVTIVEENVGPVPAKATLVGTISPDDAGKNPKKFLFDLSLGEAFRYTDLIPDDPNDPSTLRYLESFGSSSDGVVRLRGRPGSYTLVASRGTEYDLAEMPVELQAGVTRSVTAVIRRVVDTSGYVGADFHLHTRFSLDSSAPLEERIASYAAEGLEYAVSTDHNFVVDYQPVLQKLKLDRHINTAVGLELTTIDRGHFNGFPIERQSGAIFDKDRDGKLNDDTIASRTHGSFEWALRTPDQIFADLRALGRKDKDGNTLPIVLQVNHPRDSILGYFEQYGVDPETLEPKGITNALLKPDPQLHPEFSKTVFSFDFDAIEVFNGKRFEFLRTFTVPEDAPRLVVDGVTRVVEPVSCCEVQVGAVLREPAGRRCRDGGNACACDEDTFRFQVEQNNCGRVGGVAFPGVIDDWMRILETGKRVVGTANSDSHESEKEEPASPRTYVRVPVDDPPQVSPDHIVKAFQDGDILMSNGPFVRVTATGAGAPAGMGGTVRAANGKVTLSIRIESAPWVVPDTLRVLQAGKPPVIEAVGGAGVQEHQVVLDVEQDGFVIVEVSGSASLFPVIYPNEIPPLQFTDVIGSIGSAFGLGSDEGALEPALTFVTSPYALTNPIWLDADGDGVITPTRDLPIPGAARTQAEAPRIAGLMKQAEVPWVPTADEAARAEWEKLPVRKRLALSRLPRWLWPSDDPRDVRRSLLQFVRHRD
jgi:hypothetical protein